MIWTFRGHKAVNKIQKRVNEQMNEMRMEGKKKTLNIEFPLDCFDNFLFVVIDQPQQ